MAVQKRQAHFGQKEGIYPISQPKGRIHLPTRGALLSFPPAFHSSARGRAACVCCVLCCAHFARPSSSVFLPPWCTNPIFEHARIDRHLVALLHLLHPTTHRPFSRPEADARTQPRILMASAVLNLVLLLLSIAFWAVLFHFGNKLSSRHVPVYRDFSKAEQGDWCSR